MANEKQFCTFLLNDHFFGIDVLEVQEVFRYQEMTTVHLAPPVVRGLINLRGQIITAIDLRKRLGLPERDEDEKPMNVVVRTEDEVVSLLVDEIGDVLEVSAEYFEPPLGTISASMRDLITGVYKLDSQLLLILDTAKVMEYDSVA
jgi:purine-binding chemotaxis protein CheW